jgi:hypothetical protein
MPKSGVLLDYNGCVDQKTIDQLLKSLKSSKEFTGLHKTVNKRVYAIVVECLENIVKHSIKKIPGNTRSQPFISVIIQNDKIIIKTGNPIFEVNTGKLEKKLNQVNQMNEDILITRYEKIINKEPLQVENGAGLGFIIMRLKSGNKIDYSFTNIGDALSYFYFQVSINKYIMRKLIIEQTASSPKVILDPDKNIFEISGESRPPDVATFYNEVLNWFNDFSLYLSKKKEETRPVAINLNYEYFNSSSAKYLLDFCKLIAMARSKGQNISVNWHFDKDDTDMLEAGREMSRIAKFPFEFIQSEMN